MTRRLSSLLVIVALLAVPACASKKLTPETPRAAALMKVDSVGIRINELQAVILQVCITDEGCTESGVGKKLAQEVVQTCMDIRQLLRQENWQGKVKEAWEAVRARLGGVKNAAVLSVFSLVDAVLQEV